MRDTSLLNAVRVLLIVSGLLTIGAGSYRMIIEWSRSHGAQEQTHQTPSDLRGLTIAELQSLKNQLRDQMATDKKAYEQRKFADTLVIISGILMGVVSAIMFYLLRTRGPKANTKI